MKVSRFILVSAALLAAGWLGCGDDSSGDADAVDTTDFEEIIDDAPVDDGREDIGEDGDVTETSETEDAAEVEDDGGIETAFCAENPDGTSCDDENPCTTGETCSGGLCGGGTTRTCDDSDVCTDDACDPATGECTNTPNTAGCDDGDPCTVGDVCASGTCTTGAPRDCTALDDDCNTGACNATSGTCYAVPVSDGAPCDDGDVCTTGEQCSAGTCTGATPVDCSALDDQCNTGVCNATSGSCVAVPLSTGTVCNDGVSCTTGDRCRSGGICSGDMPDGDGDGYYALGCLTGDDCEDALWDVNPGATEGPVGRASCFDRLDNNCDGWSDFLDGNCLGLDFAVLDSPTTMVANVGATSALVRGRVYEPGGTEALGPMAGLTAEVGYGPYRSDPTDNATWRWTAADYLGQGGPGNTHDVFAGQFTAPAAGQYSYAFRFSTDAGAMWLYADTDGNGAASPSNGIQVDRLGTLTVIVNNHLLLTEVCVVSTGREFVEIYNPTAAAIDLSTYYLTDSYDALTTWRYWDIVTGSGTIRTWDFVIRFPAGASLAAGARATVAMGSAQTFNTSFGASPTYEVCPGSPDEATVPNMLQAWAGSACAATGPLNNSAETLVLFRWDGASDLVQDVDMFQWGDITEAMSKTGVSRDGPDAGTTTSAYAADTATASQFAFTPAPHGTTNSFERSDLSEVGETVSGGNGITGHNETSEDFSVTWRTSTAATPGT
jgi:hypothetical protein